MTREPGEALSRARTVAVAVLGLAMMLAAGGCMVGPNYRPPEMPLPDRFSQPGPTTRSALEADLSAWWKTFGDPMLDELVSEAIDSNLDLLLATARIREARANRGIAAAGLWPDLNASGSYTRSRRGGGAFGGTTGGGTTNGGTTGGGTTGTGGSSESDFYQAGFDSIWELDVFGGTRRSIEAADADIQASIEGRRDVLVTLLGDVARNYIVLRGSQRELTITEENLSLQRDTLNLTRSRFNAGLASDLDVQRAIAQVATTESQLPAIQTNVRQTIHRLSVLLGQDPAALGARLEEARPIPSVMPTVPIGLPSELLRRRPDIRQAERTLAAATARIGVATADLFPRFSLTGAVDTSGRQFKDLGNSSSIGWSIGPRLTWPIFTAGSIRANIEVQNARQEQALVQYQQAVLSALEDVEDSLVAYEREAARRQSLVQAVQANRRAFELARELNTRGLVDFLNVLDAQRSLLVAEDLLVQSDATVSTNLVALYKALGGGWDGVEQGAAATQPSPAQ